MMVYLFTQTFFWLLAAFSLGLLIGWWLKSTLTAETRGGELQAPASNSASQADLIPDSWAPEQLFDSNTVDPDPLQKIEGVTSKVEVLLNTLGIYKFEQIATMTRNNVAWISDKLGFDERIEEERWVEQASALVSDKETESSQAFIPGDSDSVA